jgi:phage terminase large subunit GpA-like protein
MDDLSPASGVERIVFQKAAQVGGSEVLLNACGFLLALSPGATLLIQPSVEMAKRFSTQRLAPMLENSPALRGLIRDPRSRDSHNTVLLKESSNGATLILTGANSAIGLRSLPARYILADELDGWPADAAGEGDPLDLAIRRSTAFGSQRKILCISTPTIDNFSRIQSLYDASDRRRFYLPCPECGHFQTLEWERLDEDGRYGCEACERRIQNHEKTAMLAAGEWRSTSAGDGRTHGYFLSALYAPVGWPSWSELIRDHAEAKRSKESLQVFTNCVLGLAWKDAETQPIHADLLMQRREAYAGEVPQGACLLTLGCDTQDDRLEAEVCAWGRDEECWSVSYSVIVGDPAQNDVWTELDALLIREYRHESGFKLTIQAACIDSGGHHSASVYEFCRQRFARKVWAAKGASGFARPIFPRRPSKGFNKAPLMMLGVDAAKEKVYSRLRIDTPGSGSCHFPLSYSREYFEQLTSERLTVRYSAGRPERVWIKPRDARNEALDVRVLNLAALHGLYQHGLRISELAERFEQMQKPLSDQKPAQPAKVYSRFFYG